MDLLRRLFSRSAPKHDRRPGVYITRSVMTGDWNAPAPARMEQMEAEASQMGRQDGEGGHHSAWTHAPKPAALRRLEARRAENLAALRAERVTAVGLARSYATAMENAAVVDGHRCGEAEAAFEHAASAADQVPEARHGFASVPRWLALALAGLLMAADILFTQMALVESLGDLPAWEGWIIAGVIGVLLFVAGIGKAYVEAVRDHAAEAGEKGPFSPAAGKNLIRFVFWPTLMMVVALSFARVSLVDWESETVGEWVAAFGGLVGITMAAVLVAVVAYMAGRILFASHPRTSVQAGFRRADRARDAALKAYGGATRKATDARAVAEGLDNAFDEALVMAEEAWMGVIALYWRGFAQARPDEQPDIDAINALTNGHRPLEYQEVYG
jgi:hypothetical protein